ncbi:MAG: HAMP domain-containing sensor histidine kinase [Mariprofundales bacterium]|nr:HAMP domain-containing sensor histidine kinase [Mariprofundales bacterium]
MRSRLSWKVGAWLLLVFFYVAYMGWDLLIDFSALHHDALQVEQANHESHHLHALELGLLTTIDPVRDFLISGDWRASQRFDIRRAQLQRALAEESDVGHAMPSLADTLTRIAAKAHAIFKLPFAVGNMEGPILMQEIMAEVKQVGRRLNGRHRQLDAQVNSAMQMVAARQLDVRDDFAVSLAILLLLLGLLSLYLYRHLVRPLVHLRHEMQKVERGDFHIHCPKLADDELGALADACNRMGEALQHREQQLNQARMMAAHHEKMGGLNLMSAGIAHELGNPLSAISLCLQTLEHRLVSEDDPVVVEQLAITAQQVARMEQIIQAFLNYGRQDDCCAMQPIMMRQVAEQVVALVRMVPNSHRMQMQVEDHSDGGHAMAHAGNLVQVLVNLLINAVDACDGGGTVTIRCRALNRGVAMEVADDGPGIPEQLQAHLFVPWFTTKSEGRGTGLGLAIGRQLMEDMQGGLDLRSSSAAGSCFRVTMAGVEEE